MTVRSRWHHDRTQMIGASQIDCSDPDGYEPPLPNTVPGLTARNLCKRFGDRQAVDGLSFDLPLGQITTLLGHNGAGKTTTISMLMGFLTPDSGTVDWGDTQEDGKEVRVGVCFQENVLYDDLSVDEHLQLMGRLRLRHLNSAELEKEVSTTANCFGLAGQKQSLARNLSGGNKRRLCVALAIIGGPRLVILDEPTAGMDVCARRSLWAELHNNKEGRAILMTTHLMDEADSIGDRITILSHGKLRAMGSPMFLKAKFANGLFLNLLKCQRYDRDAVHRLVQNHVPHCQVVRDTAVDVEFLLPGTHLKYLTGLVEQLEGGKTNLGIASFGVSLPTMDNVFINLADPSQLDKQQQNQKAKRVASSSHRDGGFAIGSDDESESTTHLPREFAPIGTRLSGIRLVLAQLRLLLLKRFVGSVRNWKGWLIQLGVPAAITCCVLLASHLFPIVTNPPPQILDTSYFRSPNIIPYQFKNSSYSAYKEAEMLQMLRQVASPVDTFVPMPADIDPNRYLADTILVRWRNQFAAITTDDDIYSNRMQLTVWWDSHAYHGPPAYFNMAWNLLLQMMSPERQYRIVTINQPLPPTPAQQQQEVRLRGQDTLAAMALVAALALALSPPLTASVKERVSGARHQQVIAGASPRLLLLSDVIVDLTSYTVAACLTALTLMIGKSSFASSTNLPALFVLFALYGLAAHPQNYLMCRNLTNPSMVHVVVLGVASATGLLPAIGHFLISSAIGEDGSRANWMGFNLNIMGAEKRDDVIHLQKLFETLWLVSPSFCVGHGLVRLSKAQLEADVKRVFDPTVDRVGPWEWELLGRVLLALAVQVCVWYPIAFFVDGRIIGMTSQSWMQWLCGLCRRSGNSQKRKVSLQGFGVQDEHQRVTSGQAIREGDQLVANELMKSYPTRGTVLSGVTFSVRSGECFGLLGPNGAGKTTTFNILTGLLRADGGEAFLGGFSTTKYPERARLMVGYCPQHDALLDFMTGREGLSLQAGLRGLHGQGAVTAVNEAIGLLQLQAIADRPMREYSGGNKRKISTAMALIGLPPVLLLDEPTAGLDPQARQFLREVVIGAKSRGQAVVMTSHSMQEARLLCDRMMFLAGGNLRCIGAPQQLTNEFCTGFITTIKPGADSNIFELTKQLRALFHPHQCSIAEQNADLIRLTISTREESRDTSINNSMTSQTRTAQLTLSTVLLSLESLRAQFPNMEYSVSETTLEQLFLRLVEMTSDVDSHGPQQTA